MSPEILSSACTFSTVDGFLNSRIFSKESSADLFNLVMKFFVMLHNDCIIICKSRVGFPVLLL